MQIALRGGAVSGFLVVALSLIGAILFGAAGRKEWAKFKGLNRIT